MKRTALVWFRNDLRLNDNPALNAALSDSDEILPVYILDIRLLRNTQWGIGKIAPHRLKFLLESVEDLNEHLQELQSGLLFKVGLPEDILPEIAQEYGCHGVYASHEYTWEERQVELRVDQHVPLKLFHSSTLIHPEDVPFTLDRLPEVFTAFRNKVEKYCQVRPFLPTPTHLPGSVTGSAVIPTIGDLGFTELPIDSRADFTFKGGALEAFKRMEYYFWETEKVSAYKETRNGLLGPDYATRFSPWLANGSISARRIYYELEAYERDVEANASTYWVKFELLWRDFFKYVAMRFGSRIFLPGGIKGQPRKVVPSAEAMQSWKAGNTGDSFVDANMRELLCTGWMSNRGRQNVASYLVHQLKQDWRHGAAWFEALLLDYDPASNYGNWMYAAGVGNDPRDRVFNTKRQADMYDREGHYQQKWLKPVPSGFEMLLSQSVVKKVTDRWCLSKNRRL